MHGAHTTSYNISTWRERLRSSLWSLWDRICCVVGLRWTVVCAVRRGGAVGLLGRTPSRLPTRRGRDLTRGGEGSGRSGVAVCRAI